MILLPIGVLWAGYTAVWYGFSLIKGEGMGINDLIVPSRIAHAREVIAGWSTGAVSGSGSQPFIPEIGVQPGSKYYPPNPNGGLPSKPPIGATPPAYYG